MHEEIRALEKNGTSEFNKIAYGKIYYRMQVDFQCET